MRAALLACVVTAAAASSLAAIEPKVVQVRNSCRVWVVGVYDASGWGGRVVLRVAARRRCALVFILHAHWGTW